MQMCEEPRKNPYSILKDVLFDKEKKALESVVYFGQSKYGSGL